MIGRYIKTQSGNTMDAVWIAALFPALFITTGLKPAVVMGGALVVVLALASVILSMMRRTIPESSRTAVQLVIVAALSIIVELVLKAVVFDVGRYVSVYIGLIAANAIMMGNLENIALHHAPLRSFGKATIHSLGYGAILIAVAFVRELAGCGTLWGCQVVPEGWYESGYMNNGMMILPPVALIAAACIVWLQPSRKRNLPKDS